MKGGCPSAAGADAVGEDDDAGVECEGAGQFQLGGGGRPEHQVGAGRLPDEQRMNPQPQLIEQAVHEQGVRQLAEPVLDHAQAGLFRQAADLVITSPLITVVVFRSGSRSVLDTTNLVMLLIRSLYGSPDPAIHAAAKPAQVCPPISTASQAKSRPVCTSRSLPSGSIPLPGQSCGS